MTVGAHRNSGKVVKDDGTESNVGDLLNASWGTATKIGLVTLGSTFVTEMKVGATGLDGRHTLFIANDSSKLIYIGNSSALSSTCGILVNSGVAAHAKLDPNLNQKIYGITFEGSAQIRVMEAKS